MFSHHEIQPSDEQTARPSINSSIFTLLAWNPKIRMKIPHEFVNAEMVARGYHEGSLELETFPVEHKKWEPESTGSNGIITSLFKN